MHAFLPARFSGGIVNWRLRVLDLTAKALGLLVHVDGYPYGTHRNIFRVEDVDFLEGVVLPTTALDRKER